jgi:hypothetical protein
MPSFVIHTYPALAVFVRLMSHSMYLPTEGIDHGSSKPENKALTSRLFLPLAMSPFPGLSLFYSLPSTCSPAGQVLLLALQSWVFGAK